MRGKQPGKSRLRPRDPSVRRRLCAHRGALPREPVLIKRSRAAACHVLPAGCGIPRSLGVLLRESDASGCRGDFQHAKRIPSNLLLCAVSCSFGSSRCVVCCSLWVSSFGGSAPFPAKRNNPIVSRHSWCHRPCSCRGSSRGLFHQHDVTADSGDEPTSKQCRGAWRFCFRRLLAIGGRSGQASPHECQGWLR